MRTNVRRDINDSLYSQIIRFGRKRCPRCRSTNQLHACHIMSRRHYNTRFMLDPVANAIPLCFSCHEWFDTHMIDALIFQPKKRVLDPEDESYTFLVEEMAYEWTDIEMLWQLSRVAFTGYKLKKKDITKRLKAHLKELEENNV